MEFFESPAFTKIVSNYLGDDDYRGLQKLLILNPDAGDLIAGSGGFRKIRWQDSRRNKGKRGGLRIIYYYFSEDNQIWFLTIYDKNEASDLTTEQKKILKNSIDKEKQIRSKTRRKL
jgi:mRNA-degrading endonuclease RelE of RelBE toxin-antitoxin system